MVPQFGFTSMLDTMELMRKTWGQMNLPAAFAPTMDVDELDRRIKDLKAVEQWLAVNMNLLRSTIQGMEVQRGTIAALNAFGSALKTPVEPNGQRARPERPPAEPAGAPRRATEPAASPREARPGGSQGLRPEDADIEAARGRGAPAAPGSDAATAAASGVGAGPADMPMLDPTAWWNLLQQQFQQVAGSALAGVTLAGAPAGTAAGTDEAQAGASARPGKRRSPPRAQNEPTGAEPSRTAARTPRRPGR